MMEEQNAEYQALQKAQQEGKNIINLQRCRACHNHNWCTQHDEKKYNLMTTVFFFCFI